MQIKLHQQKTERLNWELQSTDQIKQNKVPFFTPSFKSWTRQATELQFWVQKFQIRDGDQKHSTVHLNETNGSVF